MLSIILIILSLILDGILSNLLPFIPNALSLFTPLLTLVSIIIIYPLYKKKEKKYLLTCFVTGIIYDLLYTNLLFLNGILFVFLGLIIIKVQKNFGVNYLKLCLYIIGLIAIYETTTVILIIIFNLVPVSITKLIYKITHSLLLNIIYGEVLLFVINILPKKFKKIDIN